MKQMILKLILVVIWTRVCCLRRGFYEHGICKNRSFIHQLKIITKGRPCTLEFCDPLAPKYKLFCLTVSHQKREWQGNGVLMVLWCSLLVHLQHEDVPASKSALQDSSIHKNKKICQYLGKILVKELKRSTWQPQNRKCWQFVAMAGYGSTNEIMMYRVPFVTGRPSW